MNEVPSPDPEAHRRAIAGAPVRPSSMALVNPHLARSIREQGLLQPPNDYGYLHLAAEIERPRPWRPRRSSRRALLERVKRAAAELVLVEGTRVRRADVFDAVLIPPGSGEGRRVLEAAGHPTRLAAFDLVVLVECASVEAAAEVRKAEAFERLVRLLAGAARFVHCVTARNAARIAEVDKRPRGVFLFNYFFASELPPAARSRSEHLLAVWEYTAGWWTAKAHLTNSTPLVPVAGEASRYDLINHCRWDRWRDVLPSLVFRPSLKRFVLANFTANGIVAMPILYRLA